MNPATIAIIVSLVEQAIKDAPHLIADFKAIFNKVDPTPADWMALRERVLATSFESLAPNTPLV
jgi:hypothetical protein